MPRAWIDPSAQTMKKDHLENPGEDGSIILKRIFRKGDMDWLIWLRTGTGGRYL